MLSSISRGSAHREQSLDRGRLAIAAISAFFLFATNAQANIVEFDIDFTRSTLKQTLKVVGHSLTLSGTKTAIPQIEGSDTTFYSGRMLVDIQPTTIQLLPGSHIIAGVNPNGGAYGYAPYDPVNSDPSGLNFGVTPNANYGMAIPAIDYISVQHDLVLDNGWAGVYPNGAIGPPCLSTVMNLTGNNFNLAGQYMSFIAGRGASTSSVLGNESRDVTGDPMVFFGTGATDIGTWDGVTLTIPVHSTYSMVITNNFDGITQYLNVSGQLVLTPVVPEPSSFVLAALGLIGLAVWGWRRKR
jgi:hypothetical protein